MTQKELLYVEDAIEHEKAIIEICNESVSKLEDDELKEFFKKQITSHEDMKGKLFSLLEEKVNE